MMRFYYLRSNELEQLLKDCDRYLKLMTRPDLSFLIEFTEKLRAIDRNDEQSVVALFQDPPQLPKLDRNGEYSSHERLAYDSLQRRLDLFARLELPRWSHRSRLKALALNVYDAAWHKAVLEELLNSELSHTIDELFAEFMEDRSDDLAIPESLLQAFNSFYQLLPDKDESELEAFSTALDSFTVAVLLEAAA
jgi:hypothetical protein